MTIGMMEGLESQRPPYGNTCTTIRKGSQGLCRRNASQVVLKKGHRIATTSRQISDIWLRLCNTSVRSWTSRSDVMEGSRFHPPDIGR